MVDGKTGMPASGRLASLDAFRGFSMALLVSRGFGLYYLSSDPHWGFLGRQFTHYGNFGIHFMDLIMPFFLFAVGMAIPFSYYRRWERGETWNHTLLHAVKRFLLLLALGTALSSFLAGRMVISVSNLLVQVGGCGFVTFLLLRLPVRVQIGVSFGILLGNHLLTQVFPIPGFTRLWITGPEELSFLHRAVVGIVGVHGLAFIGSNMDKVVNTNNIAFTLWGAAAGLFIRAGAPLGRKAAVLFLAGAAGILSGAALSAFIPFSKTLCSDSYMLFCGGWSLAALSGFYWIIEVRNCRRWAYIPVAFGMNSILIYTASVIAGLGEEKLLRGFLSAGHHSRQVFLSAVWINLLFLVLMLVAIVLYRKKVFFRM